MFTSNFLKDYFRNPFLIWGLVIAVITTFDAALFSAQLMEFILLQNVYIPIMFISMSFVIIVSSYPLRGGLRKLARKEGKGNKSFAISSAILLLLVPFLESVFFASDPFVILATAQPQIVTDRETYEYILLVKNFSQFIIIPFLGAFVYTNIKSKLDKENLEIHGKLKDNLRFVAEIIIINASMFGVYLIITNYII